MGAATSTTAIPAAPAGIAPMTQAIAARRAALRLQAAKQGMGSTLLTGPAQGSSMPSNGSGGYGGA